MVVFGARILLTRALFVRRYETQNIHHVTVEDFRELARMKGAAVERAWFFSGEKRIGAPAANWRAEFAVFELSR